MLLKLQNELAGIGGNVGFLKNEIELQYNVPVLLLSDFVFQASLRAGHMRPTQTLNAVSSISDRFFLGGPLGLRGYHLFGAGPHSEGNALGARTYWVGGLHLYTPLPFRPGAGGIGDRFRTHWFLNFGNIGNFPFVYGDHYRNMALLLNRLRYSMGMGLVISLGEARFEINYVLPQGQQPGDKAEKGLQFGIGVTFV
jgi:outer membrane protein insertion porin family